MEKLSELTKDFVQQQKLTPQGDQESCDLTPEEEEEAIKVYREEKARRIRERAYWDKIRTESEPVKLTPGQYASLIQTEFYKRYPQKEFIVDDQNAEILNTLCLYFAEDKSFEGRGEGFSLNKGLLLWGPIGCGKTLLMQLFQANQRCAFHVVSTGYISKVFSEYGSNVILDYCQPGTMSPIQAVWKPEHPKCGWCFDDIGAEEPSIYYGDRRDVMAEIIQDRYISGEPFYATHLTTNMSMEDIEERYGPRVRSRMRESFNLIAFPSSAKDRRK